MVSSHEKIQELLKLPQHELLECLIEEFAKKDKTILDQSNEIKNLNLKVSHLTRMVKFHAKKS